MPWLVLAPILLVVVTAPRALFTAGSILVMLAIALVPSARTDVLCHHLRDIRLV